MRKLFVYPDKHVHLTPKYLGEQVILHPSKNYIPEGVSFAPSIKQAINAMPVFYTGDDNFTKKDLPNKYWEREYTFYVYTPIKQYEAITPETADDTDESGERRVIGNVSAKLINKIIVKSNESEKGREIHYLDYEKQNRIIKPYVGSILKNNNVVVKKTNKQRKSNSKLRAAK